MKIKKENEIVIYESDNGPTLELKLMGETLWLTQRQMAELFEKDTEQDRISSAMDILRKKYNMESPQ